MSGLNSELYNCTFPALIESWRKEFSSQADTRRDAPFGFVQLSTNKVTNFTGVPVLRWHQTADRGTVPNDRMENVFMAVAIDTYDEENGIHPRNKQIVGERLVTTGLSVAYGDPEYPTHGPVVKTLSRDAAGSLHLEYDREIS